MKSISIDKVINLPLTVLIDTVRGKAINVRFPDGILQLNASEIITSYFVYRIKLQYPKLRLTKEINIRNHYKNGVLTISTVREFLTAFCWNLPEVEQVTIARQALHANQHIYNFTVTNCLASVKTIDVLDVLALHRHKEFVALREYAKSKGSTPEVVNEIFDRATELLLKGIYNADGTLNNISWFAQRGLVKIAQVLQCSLLRGYVPDIDGELIPHCIESNLFEGMKSVRDMACLSKEAAVALVASKKDLSDVSYAGRRLSYTASYIRDVTKGDCGSEHYLTRKVAEHDLVNFQGTYYKEPGKKKLSVIKIDDVNLIGKTLHLRNPLYCTNKDTQTVCGTCYGELSHTLPTTADPGQVLSAIIADKAKQTQLSKKHSLVSDGNEVQEGNYKYFKEKASSIYFRPVTGALKVKLSISMHELKNIADIFKYDNLAIAKISAIQAVKLDIIRKNVPITDIEVIGTTKAPSMLSSEFIAYLKEHKEIMTFHNEVYTFDITHFPIKQPVFTESIKMTDFGDHIINTVAMYERRGKSMDGVNEYNIPSVLDVIYSNINVISDVHLSIVSLLLASYIITDKSYDIARAWMQGAKQGKGDKILANRSLSTAFIYKTQRQTLVSANNYGKIKTTMDHSLDVFLDPAAVTRRTQLKHRFKRGVTN